MTRTYQRCLLMAFSILIAACVRNEVVATTEPTPTTRNTQVTTTTTQAATTTTDANDPQTEVAGVPSLRSDQPEDVVEPGRYIVLGPGFPGEQRAGGWPETVIVTVPEGWSSNSRQRGGDLFSADASLGLASVANVFVDPCPQNLNPTGFDPPTALLDPPVGPTVDDLAVALAAIPGVSTTAPLKVTRAGFWGVQMNLTVPADLSDCEGETFYLWANTPSAGENWSGSSLPGWLHRIWILDVDGLRFVIDAASAPDATQYDRLQLLRMIGGIEIQP